MNAERICQQLDEQNSLTPEMIRDMMKYVRDMEARITRIDNMDVDAEVEEMFAEFNLDSESEEEEVEEEKPTDYLVGDEYHGVINEDEEFDFEWNIKSFWELFGLVGRLDYTGRFPNVDKDLCHFRDLMVRYRDDEYCDWEDLGYGCEKQFADELIHYITSLLNHPVLADKKNDCWDFFPESLGCIRHEYGVAEGNIGGAELREEAERRARIKEEQEKEEMVVENISDEESSEEESSEEESSEEETVIEKVDNKLKGLVVSQESANKVQGIIRQGREAKYNCEGKVNVSDKMSCDQLRDLCVKYDIPKSGPKKTLLHRLGQSKYFNVM